MKPKPKLFPVLSGAILALALIILLLGHGAKLPQHGWGAFGGWRAETHPDFAGYPLSFLTTARDLGAGVRNGRLVETDPTQAVLHGVIRDLVTGRQWEKYWSFEETQAGGKVILYASETRRIGSFIIPLWQRGLDIEIPPGRNVAGTSGGYSYSAVWTK